MYENCDCSNDAELKTRREHLIMVAVVKRTSEDVGKPQQVGLCEKKTKN